jgi:SAM-dependent methyltransferase
VSGSGVRRLRPRRRVGWVWVAIAAGALANSARLRERVRALPSIAEDAGPGTAVDPDHLFLAAANVDLDEVTRRAASAYATRHGLEVLDLVPGDLGTEQLLELVGAVDPASYRSSALAPGRGPRQATLVQRTVLERADVAAGEHLTPAAYAELTSQLKRVAARATDLAIAPALRGATEDAADRRRVLETLHSGAAPIAVSMPALGCAVMGAGLLLAPGWGAAALAAYCAQPHLALAGSALSPGDLTRAAALLRPLRTAGRALRTLAVPPDRVARARGRAAEAERKTTYRELLAGGLERFFEPRRTTCPLCSGTSLSVRLRSRDSMQFKPGEFELDECATCGHIFQNPRLSVEGLGFYYRDAYEGLGAEVADAIFSASGASYRARAALAAAHARPRRWLDVGTGHGHFCLVASEVLPDTRFDGLDQSDSIVEAERRRWVERGHLGQFVELADDLREGYDVVSMHHYLEHTREPAAELAAAAKVLEPGGHLLIELPDPECVYGRLFGELWMPWFQPQHQHMLSPGNLTRLLAERGFAVVAEQRGEAHYPADLTLAALFLINRIAGPPSRPWLPPPDPAARVRRAVVLTALGPLLLPAAVLDRLLAPIGRRRPGGSNAFRMLARKT